jgi:chloramphenicol 3-O phosphotransferase
MWGMSGFGWIIILNGPPRSGKSSIAEVIQDTFDGVWMNLGVDVFARSVTPARYRPGMGLRPGSERPDIDALLPALYASFYDSVAAHSRHGLNVVVDVGHHDSLNRLHGLPVLLVGVRCPIEVIMERRAAGQQERDGQYLTSGQDGMIPDPVLRWQKEVHDPGIYDAEVDTSTMTPTECAEVIRERLAGRPPSAASRVISELGLRGPARRE